MEKIILFIILCCIAGPLMAQSLTQQQIQDLQGSLADEQTKMSELLQQNANDTSQMANNNADIIAIAPQIASLQQRINDAQAVLNQVNAT